MAIDLFDLGDTPEELAAALRPVELPLAADELYQRLALSAVPIAGDRRCPDRRRQAGQLLQRRDRLRPRRLSAAQPDWTSTARLIRAFLANLESGETDFRTERGASWHELPFDPAESLPFLGSHQHLPPATGLDYDTILDLIPPGASVLDLGCGTGGLLARLARSRPPAHHGHRTGRAGHPGLRPPRAGRRPGRPEQGPARLCRRPVRLRGPFANAASRAGRAARAPRHAARRPPRHRQFPQRRLPSGTGRNWPRKAGAAGARPGTASNGTTRPMSASSRSPTSRSSAAEQGFRIRQQIALDTEADAPVHDDPNLNADVAIIVLGK